MADKRKKEPELERDELGNPVDTATTWADGIPRDRYGNPVNAAPADDADPGAA